MNKKQKNAISLFLSLIMLFSVFALALPALATYDASGDAAGVAVQDENITVYQAAQKSPVLVIFYCHEKDEPIPNNSLIAHGVTVVTVMITEERNVVNSAVIQALAALDWVEANISYFNGDPNNVTIAGEGKDAQLAIALLRVNYADNFWRFTDPGNNGQLYVGSWDVDYTAATTERVRRFHNVVLWSPIVTYLTTGSIVGNSPATFNLPYLASYTEAQLEAYFAFYGEDAYLFVLDGNIFTDGLTGSVLTNRDYALAGINILTSGVLYESTYVAPIETTWDNLYRTIYESFNASSNNWQYARFPQSSGFVGIFTKSNIVSHFVNSHPNYGTSAMTARVAYSEFFSHVALANYVGAANMSNQPVDDGRHGFYMNPDHHAFVSFFLGDNESAMKHWLGHSDTVLGDAMIRYLATFVREGFMGWYEDSLDNAILNNQPKGDRLPYWGSTMFWTSDLHMRLDPNATTIYEAASRQSESTLGLLPINMALAARANANYRALARIRPDGITFLSDVPNQHEGRTHGLIPTPPMGPPPAWAVAVFPFNDELGMFQLMDTILPEEQILRHQEDGWVGATIRAYDVDAILPDTAFMHYYLWVPPAARENPEMDFPLITFVHGVGAGRANLWQNSNFLNPVATWLDYGFQREFDTGGAFILMPYFPDTAGGLSNSVQSFSNWRNSDGSPGNFIYEAMVRKMFSDILDDFNVDPYRIILTGTSGGLATVVRTAVARPRFYAGSFVHSGAYVYNWFDMANLKNDNVWWLHGTATFAHPVSIQRMQGMLDAFTFDPDDKSHSNPFGLTPRTEWEFFNVSAFPWGGPPVNSPNDVATMLGSITHRCSQIDGMNHTDVPFRLNNLLQGTQTAHGLFGPGVAPGAGRLETHSGNYFTFTEWANSVRSPAYGYQIVFDVGDGQFHNDDLEVHETWSFDGQTLITTNTRLISIASGDSGRFAAYARPSNGYMVTAEAAPRNPVKEGFLFSGWFDSNGNEFCITMVFTENTVFTAAWEQVPTPVFIGANPNNLRAMLEEGDVILATTPGNLGIFVQHSPFVIPEGRTLTITHTLNVQGNAKLVIEGTVIVAEGGRINNQGGAGRTIMIAPGGELINYGHVENVTNSMVVNLGTIVNHNRFEVRANTSFYNGGEVIGDINVHRNAIILPYNPFKPEDGQDSYEPLNVSDNGDEESID